MVKGLRVYGLDIIWIILVNRQASKLGLKP